MAVKKIKTKLIGKNIIYFEELESTQKYAKEKIKENIENGTIIITDNQINGVGTHEKKWYSTKNDNLTFSIILYPNCKIQKMKNITIKIAQVLVETLKELYSIEVQIKEPNDLLINNKKFCGILTETQLKGENVENLVIGIGMNINQEIFEEEIKDLATSLKKECKKTFNKEEIFTNFLEKFEKVYLELEMLQ